MNYSIIIFVQSAVFFFLPVLLLPSLLLSLYYGDNGFSPFLQTMFISLGSGVVFYVAYLYINSRIPGEMRKRIKPKEAYVSVALAWLTASLMGCLPFIFLAEHSLSFINAFFETVSGFTTTGSTVIPDVTIYAK
ncbi:MAG TPA: hypothetical protein VKS21_07375, partial [Spirochaetota bacterium]|nr:hypothetical protein [Spirochaetota bacterium]